MTTVLALIGVKALWLLYIWLFGAIGASYISERKGYSAKLGLASGLLLSAIGIPLMLLLRTKPGSTWAMHGPFGRRRPGEGAGTDGPTGGSGGGGGGAPVAPIQPPSAPPAPPEPEPGPEPAPERAPDPPSAGDATSIRPTPEPGPEASSSGGGTAMLVAPPMAVSLICQTCESTLPRSGWMVCVNCGTEIPEETLAALAAEPAAEPRPARKAVPLVRTATASSSPLPQPGADRRRSRPALIVGIVVAAVVLIVVLSSGGSDKKKVAAPAAKAAPTPVATTAHAADGALSESVEATSGLITVRGSAPSGARVLIRASSGTTVVASKRVNANGGSFVVHLATPAGKYTVQASLRSPNGDLHAITPQITVP